MFKAEGTANAMDLKIGNSHGMFEEQQADLCGSTKGIKKKSSRKQIRAITWGVGGLQTTMKKA